AVLLIWIAFHLDAYFTHVTFEGHPRAELDQPWAALLVVSSFVVLTFAVHGTVQARKDNKRIADFAYGVTIPSLIFIVIMVLYGRRMDASMLIVVGLLLCCVGLLLNRGG